MLYSLASRLASQTLGMKVWSSTERGGQASKICTTSARVSLFVGIWCGWCVRGSQWECASSGVVDTLSDDADVLIDRVDRLGVGLSGCACDDDA
eukprot:3060075-Rhodomonas_salina.1